MRFVKQPLSLPVRNIDDSTATDGSDNIKRHSPLLPNSIRAIICGPSNCGKTNALISLIESPNGLRFENVYVYSKSLEQPKYKYLERLLSGIEGVNFYKFSSQEQVIKPENVKPNSIFIFDDVACDNQNVMKQYYCMGRHKGVDCFYLIQTYTRCPKHLLRDNVNFLILFKQDELNLKHIFNDCSISCDMTFKEFQELCNSCWREKYGFLVIDLDSPVNNGRYRKGFDKYLHIVYKAKSRE